MSSRFVYVLVESGKTVPLGAFDAPSERPYLLPPDAVALKGPFLDVKAHVHREVVGTWRSALGGGKTFDLVALKVQSIPVSAPEAKRRSFTVEEILAREA